MLIYALLQEGLGAWQAGQVDPNKIPNGSITLSEWLGYAVERVPRLYEEVKAGEMQVSDAGAKPNGTALIIRDTVDLLEIDNEKIQRPALFDFNRRKRDVIIARLQFFIK